MFSRATWARRTSMLLGAAVLVGAAGAARAAVTMAQATTFFKDFDTQTLSGKGKIVNQVYGVTDPTDAKMVDAAKIKAQTDIFSGFANIGQKAVTLEALKANGKTVPAAAQKAVDDAYSKLKTDGVMQRLSSLQLGIFKDNFNDAGAINFDDLETSMQWFANGQLRTGGGAGAREMDQYHQWFIWKQFAVQAINNDVDKASWQKILPMLETGLEIYAQVYTAPDPNAGLGDPLTTRDSNRFKAANQLSDAARTNLGNTIKALNMADILKREASALKDATPSYALATPDRNLDFTTVQLTPQGDDYLVYVVARLTDAATGDPITGATIAMDAGQVGIELPQDGYYSDSVLADMGNGNYAETFLVTGPVDAIELYANDPVTLADAEAMIAVPEPSAVLVVVGVAVAGVVARRRRR